MVYRVTGCRIWALMGLGFRIRGFKSSGISPPLSLLVCLGAEAVGLTA